MLKNISIFILTIFMVFNVSFGDSEDNNVIIQPEDISSIFVEVVTSKGNIILELNPAKAPNTVGNFIQYVVEGYYDGLIFHRVIPNFMIQGGGWDENLALKETRDSVGIESNNGLDNDKGTIAMARMMDPDSATSQFFINTVDNDFLNYIDPQNPGYTVFGKVVDGMDVVTAIESVKTEDKGAGRENVPVEAVIIEKISLIENPAVNATSTTEKPAKDESAKE